MDPYLVKTIQEYAEVGWMPTMIRIWRDKIDRMRIVRSGALHESFNSRLINESDGQTISMKFLEYGIYQASGVGYGFLKHYSNRIPGTNKAFKVHSFGKHNFGDLEFMGGDYRAQHGLDKPKKVGPAWGGYMTSGQPRKRRDWFNPKLYRSVFVLKEDLARITGEEAAAVVCEALTDMRRAVTTTS